VNAATWVTGARWHLLTAEGMDLGRLHKGLVTVRLQVPWRPALHRRGPTAAHLRKIPGGLSRKRERSVLLWGIASYLLLILSKIQK